MAKYTEEQKQKALVLAEANSIVAAADKTGIPSGTIKRWRYELRKKEKGEPNQRTEPNPNRPSKKVKQVAQEATQEAKAMVREHMAERSKEVAEAIISLVEEATHEARNVIAEGPNHGEEKNKWLRSVVGALIQGVEKYQLLTGKATGRLEGQVNHHHEHEQKYHIIQELVTDPELASRIENNFRRGTLPSQGKE